MNITIPRDELLAALRAVRRACSDDVTRPHMCAVEIRVHTDRVTVVGTDEHRMHVWSAPWTVDRTAEPGLDRALISAGDVHTMIAALKASRDTMVTLALRGALCLSACDVRFAPGDAEFPHWQQVMPKPDRNTKALTKGIGVCADYMADACASFYDAKAAFGLKRNQRARVIMGFGDAQDAIQITSADVPALTCIIMPVRIG